MEGAPAIASETPACAGCGGRDWAPLVEQNGYSWWRCRACALARLIPMPAEPAARAEIGGDAMGRRYIEGYRAKLANKMRRSARRLRRLAKLMPGKQLLDVGSNVGCLVEAGRRIGLDTVGVEINRTLIDFARETYPACRFLAAPIEEAPLDGATFDGVYCSEVIEHVPDQDRFVAAIAALMRPGGVLFLTTPGAHEYVRGGAARARDFGAPDHKIYHTRASLKALLQRHGIARVRFVFNFGRGLKAYGVKGSA
ncbi:MAG TPA: methyltransferase domain-containing protein [Alphaproteobacteria bacterium]|jgi:SAM-dependent methyltransferase